MSAGPAAAAVRVDLRLVPPAVAAWGTALAVVHAPAAAAALAPGALAGLCVAAVLVLALAVRHVAGGPSRPGGGPPAAAHRVPGRPRAALLRAAPAVALSAATVAVVVVAGGGAHALRAPAPLLAAVDDGRGVQVRGRVADAPRPVGETDGSVRFTVAASAVAVGGRWHRVRTRVDVVAPGGAPLGAAVHLRGTVAAATGGAGPAVRLRARQPPVVTAPPPAAQAWADGVRGGARAVSASLPPDVRGLLPAVSVGDTSRVPGDLVTAMRSAGLAHVMAVSGAHFAILGALVLAAASAVRAPRVLRVAAVAASGAGLLLVVGPAPSVVRAAVMGAIGLLGLLAGRRAAGPAALAAAVVALLAADPWLAVDVGFALSVAATAGLVVLGGPLVTRWSPRCGRAGATLLAAPVAAQLGCLPVTLALWPTLGPWSVLANLVVAPVIAPATVLGLLAALLADLWPAAAGALAAVAGAACWWLAAVARCAAALPGAGLAWWPGPGGAVAAVLVVVAAGVLVLRQGADR